MGRAKSVLQEEVKWFPNTQQPQDPKPTVPMQG